MTEQNKRYWLSNAHSYLKKFQQQKLCQHNISRDTVNQKQKTFDQCELPSSKQSPQKSKKFKIKQQIDFNMKKKEVQNVYVTTSIVEHSLQNEKNNKIENDNKVGLSDLIIKEHLTKTLKIYQQDLVQLQENRENLIQAIEEITTKIQNLTELQSKNQILQLQNFKNKRQILALMRQYHDMKLNTERKKIQMEQKFLKKKQRIKSLIQTFPQQTQFVTQSQSFDYYLYQLKINRQISNENPPQNKVLQQIFPKTEEPQKPKAKDKSKSKVIDKAGLLGDLKSFAKNFKMPNNVNQS